jgi:uncharacterized protein DUF3303
MLFHVLWRFCDTSEEGQKRSFQVFEAWQPPAEAEFRGFYGFADNSGGVAIIEAGDAATIMRITAPFTPWMTFTITPILSIEEATALAAETIEFRESVS